MNFSRSVTEEGRNLLGQHRDIMRQSMSKGREDKMREGAPLLVRDKRNEELNLRGRSQRPKRATRKKIRPLLPHRRTSFATDEECLEARPLIPLISEKGPRHFKLRLTRPLNSPSPESSTHCPIPHSPTTVNPQEVTDRVLLRDGIFFFG